MPETSVSSFLQKHEAAVTGNIHFVSSVLTYCLASTEVIGLINFFQQLIPQAREERTGQIFLWN